MIEEGFVWNVYRLFVSVNIAAVHGDMNAMLGGDVPYELGTHSVNEFVSCLLPFTDTAADSGSPGSRGASEMSRTPAKVSETNRGS